MLNQVSNKLEFIYGQDCERDGCIAVSGSTLDSFK